ncbi:hypothetical protein [Streptomyces sp. NRRL F-5123]|uniref:hypothetical protein n=1 Tax=Streptomyces sp. NRRL F-5123 TaxID=1463856 RepID=UPI00069470F5|nr:hypothetical protein [Streptomyces sp. NRRL F-5123]
MRAGIAAAAVAAALALGGCGSGGGKDDATATATGQPDSPSASPSASASVQPATSTAPAPTASPTNSAQTAGADGGATDTVEGVWLAAEGATKVQLVLGAGKAGLTSAHLCGGGYTGKEAIALTLTCMDGDTERTTGRGQLAADGKTLTVTWTNGPTDVFARTGLPSD